MMITDIDDQTGLANQDMRQIFQKRRDKLRSRLIAMNLDALLVTDAANRFYLSGFELHDPQPNESAGMLLVTTDGADWLLTDSRYALAAERLWDKEHIYIYAGSGAMAISTLLNKHCSLTGFESDAVGWNFIQNLKTASKRKYELIKTSSVIAKMRMIKDNQEIAALRKSFALNHKMFEWVEKHIQGQSMTEEELAWEIERFFRENGAQELAFSTIAASGVNAALPHAIPGKIKITNESALLIDAGCRVDNYCSDQTRTFWHGQHPSADFEKTMDIVREAQKTALDMMRPGVACSAVYKAARDIFAHNGVEKYFNHGLGHGVGLETHEAPSLSPRSQDNLTAGMAVTVEPGLYYPQWGGIRWEYTVLVNANGVEIL